MSSAITVPPDRIESELKRILEPLQGAGKMRACLFNLILYTEKGYRTDYIRKIAQRVIQKFPCRLIFISLDRENKQSSLVTKVSAVSPSGQSGIVCDLIEIEVSASEEMRVPFTILPHILPDLPVYLLWTENPTKTASLSPELEKLASRIIFDSESAENLPHFAKAALQHQIQSNCDIADLNWGRIENWRDLFASVFHSEEMLSQLGHIKSMQIAYNAQETAAFCHTKIQSIYLQGWLACQLEWNFKQVKSEKENLVFSYARDSSPFTVTLTPVRYKELPPGMILSVEILTEDGTHFSFHRNIAVSNQISIQISTCEKCELPSQYISAKAESGFSLVKEICHKGTSAHYLKLLKLLAGMEALSTC